MTGRLVLAMAGLLLAAGVAGAQEGPTVAALARNCMGCHGEDGNSPGAMATIRGKSANWLAESLADFRSGARESTIMGRIMGPFADEDIAALATYFAAGESGR